MRIEPGAVFEGYSRRVERDEVPTPETKQLPPSMQSLRSAAERVDIATHAEAGH